jgi:hypothetical protein
MMRIIRQRPARWLLHMSDAPTNQAAPKMQRCGSAPLRDARRIMFPGAG